MSSRKRKRSSTSIDTSYNDVSSISPSSHANKKIKPSSHIVSLSNGGVVVAPSSLLLADNHDNPSNDTTILNSFALSTPILNSICDNLFLNNNNNISGGKDIATSSSNVFQEGNTSDILRKEDVKGDLISRLLTDDSLMDTICQELVLIAKEAKNRADSVESQLRRVLNDTTLSDFDPITTTLPLDDQPWYRKTLQFRYSTDLDYIGDGVAITKLPQRTRKQRNHRFSSTTDNDIHTNEIGSTNHHLHNSLSPSSSHSSPSSSGTQEYDNKNNSMNQKKNGKKKKVVEKGNKKRSSSKQHVIDTKLKISKKIKKSNDMKKQKVCSTNTSRATLANKSRIKRDAASNRTCFRSNRKSRNFWEKYNRFFEVDAKFDLDFLKSTSMPRSNFQCTEQPANALNANDVFGGITTHSYKKKKKKHIDNMQSKESLSSPLYRFSSSSQTHQHYQHSFARRILGAFQEIHSNDHTTSKKESISFHLPVIKNYSQLDDRVRKELLILGFSSYNASLNPNNCEDDDVSVALRTQLQLLRQQIITNNKIRDLLHNHVYNEVHSLHQYKQELFDAEKKIIKLYLIDNDTNKGKLKGGITSNNKRTQKIEESIALYDKAKSVLTGYSYV